MSRSVKLKASTIVRIPDLLKETLLEQQHLTEEARELQQQSSRNIREKFTYIIVEGFSRPFASLFRKASIWVEIKYVQGVAKGGPTLPLQWNVALHNNK